jgi:hypothetical protein
MSSTRRDTPREILAVMSPVTPMYREQIAQKLGGFDEGWLEILLWKMSAKGLIELDPKSSGHVYWLLTSTRPN